MKGVISVAIILLFLSGCSTTFQANQAEFNQGCEIDNATYICRLIQATAVHGSITQSLNESLKAELIGPKAGRAILGDPRICTNITMIDKPVCHNLQGAKLLLLEADNIGDNIQGQTMLNKADLLIRTAERLLLARKRGE